MSSLSSSSSSFSSPSTTTATTNSRSNVRLPCPWLSSQRLLLDFQQPLEEPSAFESGEQLVGGLSWSWRWFISQLTERLEANFRNISFDGWWLGVRSTCPASSSSSQWRGRCSRHHHIHVGVGSMGRRSGSRFHRRCGGGYRWGRFHAWRLVMLVQVGLEGKSLMTARTLEVLWRGMGLHMSSQIGTIGETLSANRTWVGLLSGVWPEVALKKPRSREGLPTDVALVIQVVSENVHWKGGHGHVHLPTYRTFLRISRVQTPVSLLMAGQIRTRGVILATLWTSILGSLLAFPVLFCSTIGNHQLWWSQFGWSGWWVRFRRRRQRKLRDWRALRLRSDVDQCCELVVGPKTPIAHTHGRGCIRGRWSRWIGWIDGHGRLSPQAR